MKLKKLPKCMQAKTTYTFDYPEMLQYEQMQMENYWMPEEPKIENDTHELRTGLTPAEYHGVITTLKLFTLYELHVGKDYWLGNFMKMFPRPEFERLASCFGMTELNIHAPFYNKVNEILRLNTDEFYESYADDPALKDRMDYLNSIIDSDNRLLSLAIFSMIEGAVLYSSFAFLKHFQVNGKNKLGAVVAGIDFSVRDENIHSVAGSHAFRIVIDECLENNIITQEEINEIYNEIIKASKKLKEHEYRIIEMIFEKGPIVGVTEREMKSFVKSRINLCLNNLGIDAVFEVKNNTIAKWFYDNINMPTIHDFFVNLGSQYNRNWSEKAFIVKEDKYNFIG